MFAIDAPPDAPATATISAASQPASARVGAEGAGYLCGIGALAQLRDVAVVLLSLAIDRILKALDDRLQVLHASREVLLVL
jgi:hypothetical protein